jgi:hypothetical protein
MMMGIPAKRVREVSDEEIPDPVNATNYFEAKET